VRHHHGALRRRYGRAQPAIGKGAQGYILPHHKYAIVGLVPRRGRRGGSGEHLKTRYVVGRARDADEALVELYRMRHGAVDGGWDYIVLDLSAKRGKIAPIVTVAELEARKARGQ
jgi:hypothetical protein